MILQGIMANPKKPQLLAPAGSWEKMKIALEFGADAVYLGVPDFSLRARVNNFTPKQLKKAAEYCRARGKDFYLTLNIYAHQDHLKRLPEQIELIRQLQPSAVIASDPGIIARLKKEVPEIPLHLSTQANVTNAEAARFWLEQGIERVILARELSLPEIIRIKKEVPKLELEYFVHGAMCMAYSGRCLLSNWITGRGANLGDCAQPCRWKYQPQNTTSEKISLLSAAFNAHRSSTTPRAKPRFFLELCSNEKAWRSLLGLREGNENERKKHLEDLLENEALWSCMDNKNLLSGDAGDSAGAVQGQDYSIKSQRSDEGEELPRFKDDQGRFEMELEEDEKGTYLFNSYDINLIDQLDKLWEAGVESFKIEGRSKSVYYVAVATRAYRKVLDGLVQVKAGELPPSAYGELIEEQKQELEKLSHRGYWTGFLLGQQPPHLTEQDAVRSVWEFVGIAESADPERSDSKSGTQAKLKKIDKKWREVFVHNALRVGDAVEVVTPQGNQQVRVEQIRNDKGEKVASAHGGQNEIFSVEFSQVVKEGVFLLRKKIG